MFVYMYNPAPREWINPEYDDDGNETKEGYWNDCNIEGLDQITRIPSTPEGWKALEVFLTITLSNGIWERHSSAVAPSWIMTDSPALAEMLDDNYGITESGNKVTVCSLEEAIAAWPMSHEEVQA